MLTATIEIAVSMRRTARRSGERVPAMTCLMKRTTRARLQGEELVKEKEMDSIRLHEEEISPVLQLDRRVSLMGLRVTQ